MKTIVLNTFSSFATFPMFNPAYLKGLLCRNNIENTHIDVNVTTWNALLDEKFLKSLSFNEEILNSSNFPYSIIFSQNDFEVTKEKVINRIHHAKEILRSSNAANLKYLLWAQRVIYRALNLIYCHYGTFFLTNIPFWAGVGFDCNDINQIYNISTDYRRNPLIGIFESIIIPIIKKERPNVILVDIMFPWDIIPALTLNTLLKRYLPSCHINYAGLGFDEFSFSRIRHNLKNRLFFFNFDSVFVYRNDNGIIQLVNKVLNHETISDIENLYLPHSFGVTNKNYFFDETIIPNYDDICWEHYFFPERLIIDRLSYKCFWSKCNFCSINSNKGNGQVFHVSQQITKIRNLHKKYNVSNFWFLDEACPVGFAIKFAEGISKESITWSLRTRLDQDLTRKNIEKLARSGLKELWIGLEHVDKDILSLMNKSNFNSEYALIAQQVFEDATKCDIGLHFCHILGFPSENDSQRKKVSEFYEMNKENIGRKPFFTTFNIFGLMKDSPMYLEPSRFGITRIYDENTKYNMIKVPYETIYDDDTGNIKTILSLNKWINTYTNLVVKHVSLIPLWVAISDTPFELLLKKNYNYNPFFQIMK